MNTTMDPMCQVPPPLRMFAGDAWPLPPSAAAAGAGAAGGGGQRPGRAAAERRQPGASADGAPQVGLPSGVHRPCLPVPRAAPLLALLPPPPPLHPHPCSPAPPRLCSEPPAAYPQWPVHYLIGVYARAAGERWSGGWAAARQLWGGPACRATLRAVPAWVPGGLESGGQASHGFAPSTALRSTSRPPKPPRRSRAAPAPGPPHTHTHTHTCLSPLSQTPCPADEQRNVRMLKDPAQQAALAQTLGLCRQLAVSYAGLTLLMDMFPQVGWWCGRQRVGRCQPACPAGGRWCGQRRVERCQPACLLAGGRRRSGQGCSLLPRVPAAAGCRE